jgi:hypothetical protein
VLVRCPACNNRAMVSVLNASGTRRELKSGGGWPRCKQCCPATDLKHKPRVEPIGDVSQVARVRPGFHATAREAKRITAIWAEPPAVQMSPKSEDQIDG